MNLAHLRQQINRCNYLLNKNKGQYYQELLKEIVGMVGSCDQHCARYRAGPRFLPFHPVPMKNHWQISLVHFYRQN